MFEILRVNKLKAAKNVKRAFFFSGEQQHINLRENTSNKHQHQNYIKINIKIQFIENQRFYEFSLNLNYYAVAFCAV